MTDNSAFPRYHSLSNKKVQCQDGTTLSELLVNNIPYPSPNIQAIMIALGYALELDSKTLKEPHS